MRLFLIVMGAIALLLGLFVLVAANGALHEIEGLVLLVITAVAWGAAGIIRAIYDSSDPRVGARLRDDEPRGPVHSVTVREVATERRRPPSREPTATASAMASTPSADGGEIKALVQRAQNHQYAKEFAQAVTLYEEVVTRFPDSKQADFARTQLKNLR